jgi:hypothetical protein
MKSGSRIRRCAAAGLLLNLLLPSAASAHGGGLNAEGCHNNRKTGDYHCHRAPVRVLQEPAQAAHVAAQPASAAPRPVAAPTCYTGPRGGTYTITSSGRKNYSGC